MGESTRHIRHGLGAVRPYLHGPAELVDLVEDALGAVELERHAFGPNSFHVELRVGDGVLVIEAGELPPGTPAWTGSVYVYVEDVDEAYRRALARGARSVAAPADKPYQERQAGFVDMAGNTWWIGAYQPA
ncbi:MAG: hypothetical protein M9894_14540 [Planctomycetes bacterium]|nr:hypothetical protein [Planctomycetota bacterium]